MNTRQDDDFLDISVFLKFLLRQKIAIAVTCALVLLLALPGILFEEKLYQAQASIMIIPSKLTSVFSPTNIVLQADQKASGEYVGPRPTISISSHKELLKSSVVLDRLLKRCFQREEQAKTKASPAVIPGNFSIREIPDTNILLLQVQSSTPAKAQEAANAWAEIYVQYSQELIAGEIKGTGDFIQEQFEFTQKELVHAEEQVKEFQERNKIDIAQADLDLKKSKYNDYKKMLIELDADIKAKENQLQQLKKEIASQPKFIVVSKAITDDALWQSVSKKADLGALANRKLQSEILNPIYSDLASRIVNTEIELNTLRPKMEYIRRLQQQTRREIDGLSMVISQYQFELKQLNRQVEIVQKAYNNLSARIEDTKFVNSAQLGEVRIVSPATLPQNPMSVSRKATFLQYAVLGIICGIVIAFLKEAFERYVKKRVSI